jgi:small multidrug resistance family-3 protein
LRHDKTAWWAVVAAAGLGLFAWLLTLHPMANAGRVYAAYGGVYIAASLCWLWLVEGQAPDRWDLTGTVICVLGAAVIYFGPRG